ncbi:MAG: hypothetical protein GWP63_20250 [Haliea sp.]|nr:hypothetical protein [Haliea sp.]
MADIKRRDLARGIAAAGAAMALGATSYPLRASMTGSVENTPVILEVAISGSNSKARNLQVPETVEEHIAEMDACFKAGATIVHTHSNQPNKDVDKAVEFYRNTYKPVREMHPYGIIYATANFAPQLYNKMRAVWPAEVQCGHHEILAREGLANMVLLDTGVVALGGYDDKGVPSDKGFFWYGFWPDDTRFILDVCRRYGPGTSISVFEPGWMKNVVAMAKGGTLPRGSKLNIYFGGEGISSLAPPIPEALELYLKMMEGLDLKWSVGNVGNVSIMDTPLAQMALERGGSFRVGLEDWATGPGNLEQMARAREMINRVGRPVVTGKEAIEYLDIPFPPTRP